jgi:hypothetical protein
MSNFTPGKNIAMKVPVHEYEATIKFYREILGFKELTPEGESDCRFDFGGKVLWIDCVSTISQAEIWLEVNCRNPLDQAAAELEALNVTRCDEIEPLPDGFPGFWIKSPGNIVHLVTKQAAS